MRRDNFLQESRVGHKACCKYCDLLVETLAARAKSGKCVLVIMQLSHLLLVQLSPAAAAARKFYDKSSRRRRHFIARGIIYIATRLLCSHMSSSELASCKRSLVKSLAKQVIKVEPKCITILKGDLTKKHMIEKGAFLIRVL